jgi:uncharacterized GH25 family protein
MVPGFWRGIALTVAVGVSGTAHAHEFIVKPGAMTVQVGASLQVAGLSSHIFLISEELEAARDVKVGFYVDGKRTDIAVKPNEKTLAYDGTVTAPSNATFIVTGARLPQIWATTPQGLKQVIRKTPGASNPYKIEKFSKALVNVTPADNGFSTVIGDTLEIVPLTNPATVKPGDELTVKVRSRPHPQFPPHMARARAREAVGRGSRWREKRVFPGPQNRETNALLLFARSGGPTPRPGGR